MGAGQWLRVSEAAKRTSLCERTIRRRTECDEDDERYIRSRVLRGRLHVWSNDLPDDDESAPPPKRRRK